MSLTGSVLKSVDVSGDFIDNIGLVTVTQTYLNQLTEPSEAKYVFSLDKNSSINSFKMTIGSKIIIGEVKEKTKAKEEYDTAKSEGKKTSLLTKLSNNNYKVSIANINPNEEVIINYTFVTTLEFDDNGRYKFILPTNIAPKYSGSTNQTVSDSVFAKALNSITYMEKPPYTFNINLNFTSNSKIINVESLTNKIDINLISENKINVTSKTVPSSGDFNLFIKPSVDTNLYTYTETINTRDQTTQNDQLTQTNTYSFITCTIPNEILEKTPKNYYFLLDRSGSMDSQINYHYSSDYSTENKITQAKTALKKFIEKIDCESYFNIYSFGSTYTKMFEKTISASDKNKQNAIQMLNEYGANMGGTEIYECLKNVLCDDNSNSGEKIIVFLTDGQVSNRNSIINLINSYNSNNSVRIFSVGIGNDADRELVQQMSKHTHGDCKFVTDSKDLTTSILSILETVNKQYYTNVIFGSDDKKSNTKAEQITYSSVYPNNTYSFVGKNITNYVLNAYNPITKQQVSWNLMQNQTNVQLQIEQSNNLVKTFYANVLLNYLIDFKNQLPYTKNASVLDTKPEQYNPEQLLEKIIKLSVEYQIMCDYTSYILVDDVVSVENGKKLVEQNVPHAYKSADYGEVGKVFKSNIRLGSTKSADYGESDCGELGKLNKRVGSAKIGMSSPGMNMLEACNPVSNRKMVETIRSTKIDMTSTGMGIPLSASKGKSTNNGGSVGSFYEKSKGSSSNDDWFTGFSSIIPSFNNMWSSSPTSSSPTSSSSDKSQLFDQTININLDKIILKQNPNGSFNLTFDDLLFSTKKEYENTYNDLNLSKQLFDNIIMYSYLRNNSKYTKQFEKLEYWFTSLFPNIDINKMDETFSSYKQEVKY
jgi:hypothetical protein